MKGIKTHLRIDNRLSGFPEVLEEGYALVRLKTSEEMAADDKGLVHGGFIFSAADYASMLAVNHPNVVLAGANVKFLKPAKVGDELIFQAKVENREGKKIIVSVEGKKEGELIFKGDFTCVIPDKHVLD
ncbi:methylthioribose-1-phosphate isomerase [Hydrogenivirga caldilitoris]|uniref:Methylthioribose-1-phosphate isomerase n=1 Tax=Hydrogenivirga caldilitoris TaxID=246264 RepID=A0A497XU50_9AQUI|nr:PaaI family thioesterase [Hydrogenivirga caldilitoris]RLJ71549.1 methylthioribose-1-phosphate isomerase [Hydrogenivirga caldilitoris]